MAAATAIVLTAGGITFVNEWYWTRQVNWRVPVATLFLAAIFDGLAKLDPKAGTGLSIMLLIGALMTEFNGHSAASTIAQLFPAPGTKKTKGKLWIYLKLSSAE
jgi:hypothetical protein